ncbi:MAG: dTDP-4-dehydrorhamnose reductase [Selenomonadaceae bacterium]|nr:dTDP-4-dehydrorhamnose reductase [Selenomonadaceae bacterium]
MKVMVTGITGQLGFDVMRELAKRNIESIGAARKDFDLTDEANMRSFIERHKPDAIIHCAAYTAVDKAEDEPELAMSINGRAVGSIAKICRELDCKLLHISTDYMFPGDGVEPYEVDDRKAPTNAYGRSKLAGEEAVLSTLEKYFIVRISWAFGINGKNFVRTMLRLSETRDRLTVVDDQIGSPTYTADLARLLVEMVQTERYGVYHATNEGFCSWAEFAAEIFRQAEVATTVEPVESGAYPTKAIRPKNSRMSKKSLDAAGFERLPSWKDAVGRYLIELAAEHEHETRKIIK